jgi:hypothetical protein
VYKQQDHRLQTDTQEFEDAVFTLKELEHDDSISDFSLGHGTKDMIKMKADSILE